MSLIRDPIIDYDKINLLKNQKIESKFYDKKFFVSIGRLTYQKNFLFLTKCFKKILSQERKIYFLNFRRRSRSSKNRELYKKI